MAATADVERIVRADRRATPQLVNSAQVFSGALLALKAKDFATAASRGRAQAYAAAADDIPLGFKIEAVQTGDTTASPITRTIADLEPRIMRTVPVTGLAGTFADVGQQVFASDDATFTLTRPTRGLPFGVIVDFEDGTNATVFFFGFETLCVLALAGSGKELWNLGMISAERTASGNVLTGIVAPHKGRFVNFYGIVARDATDADVDQDLNLEIDGVDVTGGVIEYLFSDATGVKKQGTAITALNIFHEGSLIDVDSVVNTAGTAADPGAMNLYAEIEMDLGL